MDRGAWQAVVQRVGHGWATEQQQQQQQQQQQNWDHLNWVQPADSKYKSFHYKK